MKTFKYILISSIIIFILNFPAHFAFEFLQFDIISYFFPTNESIFQHMKMIFTVYMLFYLILLYMKKKIGCENIALAALVGSLSTIFSFLIIYLPVYFIFGESMIFTFILLFLAIVLGEFVASFILTKKDYKYLNIISLVIIFIIFFINAYLTYNPKENFFFYDENKNTYNIVYK